MPNRLAIMPARSSLLALVLGGALAVGAAIAGPVAAEAPDARRDKIVGIVGPEFTLTLDRTEVPAGRYTIVVKDRATAHNFHLLGEGVDRRTSLPRTKTYRWKVDLVPGVYEAFCDPHPVSMKQELVVT